MLFAGVGRYETTGQAKNYDTLYGEPRYLAEGIHPVWKWRLQYLERSDRFEKFRQFALREYENPPYRREVLEKAWIPAEVPKAGDVSFWTWVANRYDRFAHIPFYGSAKVWVGLLAGLAVLSTFLLFGVRSPETTPLACFGLIVPLSALGALLLIALVEEGLNRYLYPIRFLFHLAPLLMVAIYLQVRSEQH
jgi:hypothetical protein